MTINSQPREDMPSHSARWREIVGRKCAPSLALVCAGVWLHAADSLLVATMMPAIVGDIGGLALIPWTVALYEIGSIVAGVAGGFLALRHGLRAPMATAACFFSAGCAISALAPEMWLLLVGRLLQGLGGGGLMALSFVSVGLLFPARLMARAMGAVSTVWAISAFMGPLIGGLFVEWGSWRGGFWAFAAQAALLAIWLATRRDIDGRQAANAIRSRFPFVRLLWLSAGVVLIAYAGVEVLPMRTPILVLAGLACLAVFLAVEARSETAKLLPRHPLSLRNRLGAALTMILCFAAATVAIGIYVPFLITRMHGVSALVAGYIIALEAIAWAVAAAILSGRPERHDPQMIVTGLTIVAISILCFAYSVAYGPLWMIALSGIVQGFGFGTAWTFILRRATSIASSRDAELVSGAIPTVQRLGYALGAAYVGIVANAACIERVSNSALSDAAIAIFVACLPLAALGLVATARFVKSEPAEVLKTGDDVPSNVT
ncbi:MAG: MFS transporter [Pseudomonadota bacterium]